MPISIILVPAPLHFTYVSNAYLQGLRTECNNTYRDRKLQYADFPISYHFSVGWPQVHRNGKNDIFEGATMAQPEFTCPHEERCFRFCFRFRQKKLHKKDKPTLFILINGHNLPRKQIAVIPSVYVSCSCSCLCPCHQKL